MDSLFSLLIKNDRMEVSIDIKQESFPTSSFSPDQLVQWLSDKNVVFGIDQNAVNRLCYEIDTVHFPFIIAKGHPPLNGHDGYLINRLSANSNNKHQASKLVNFKDILNIPSVKSGQLIASVIPPTPGIVGKDVNGNPVKAKDGKPFSLKPGKNIIFNMGNVYSTIDGQISFMTNSVNVFPVYEVPGDLDMKTGNIDFIGNVVVKGNVPNGFRIKAGGDIKIFGLVEGAELEAGGSILVSGGITAGHKGYVRAGIDIHSQYLNQANCVAGKTVTVDGSILHSNIEAGERIIALHGQVIGGRISSVAGVEVRDIGSIHYIKTEVWIGQPHQVVSKINEIEKSILSLKSSLDKLNLLKSKLHLIEKQQGMLSQKESLLLEKQKLTQRKLESDLSTLTEEEQQLRAIMSVEMDASLTVLGTMYPNTEIHFGKYSKLTNYKCSNSKVKFLQGEISTIPL